MNKQFILILASALMISSASCTDEVGKMESEEALHANGAPYETMPPTEAETETEPPTEPPTEKPTVAVEMPEGHVVSSACSLEVETIMQKPELPTGCEVVSLATVLNYNGFEIDKVELCDNFLPIDYTTACTFNEAYIGNPKSNNGYGCYAPVIAETARLYFESVGAEWEAKNLSGTDFRDLFYQIEEGRPVVIWASMNLRDVKLTLRWTTADGDEAWFSSLEHCMVLTGYDTEKGVVYASDPLKGDMEYSLERFESVYEQMGKQAVVVYDKESPL